MIAGMSSFRLFVSSTFEDFELERNYLAEHVWPRLRDHCARTGDGARFQAIDLRWGVAEEVAADQRTMGICLEEIDRCRQVTPRPNFLVLLGDRAGWCPLPERIPADEYLELRGLLAGDAPEDLAARPEVRDLLDQWYERDANAVPAEYRLLPRSDERLAGDAWNDVENQLQPALASAARAHGLEGARLLRYAASATHQEIERGARRAAPDEVVCFLRSIPGAPPDSRWKAHDDETVTEHLRDTLRSQFPGRVLEETVGWTEAGPELDETYLQRFSAGVETLLKSAIDAELANPRPPPEESRPEHPVPADDALDDEGRAHHDEATERVQVFVGREPELARVSDYLTRGPSRPLVVVGEGGTGKSSLLAEVVRRELIEAKRTVVYRFIGATPASADDRGLLGGMCRELARRSGEPEADVPVAFSDLVVDFADRLRRAAELRPVLVVIDSLDQLAESEGARLLAWVPRTLPDGAQLVLSTRPIDTLERLEGRAEQLQLGGLSRAGAESAFDRWLEQAARTVQPEQRRVVLDRFEQSAGNPLYLRLVFEEARRWPSQDLDAPQRLAVGVRELIRENLVHRLAVTTGHGNVLVGATLGYLAASRYGLAEDELLDLLSRDPAVYGSFLVNSFHLPPDLVTATARARAIDHDAATTWLTELVNTARHGKETPPGGGLDSWLTDLLSRRDGPRLPAAPWSRLLFDLGPYLGQRPSEGGALLAFAHRELTEVSSDLFATGESGLGLHAQLAAYFRDRADPVGDGSWGEGDSVDRRGLSELPYHLTKAERWDDVTAVLTDFRFLERKAAEVGRLVQGQGDEATLVYTGVFQLQDDFDLALAGMRRGDDSHDDRYRLIVTGVDLGAGLVVHCPHCNADSRFEDAWRGADIACPLCGGPLRVNPFTVARPTT